MVGELARTLATRHRLRIKRELEISDRPQQQATVLPRLPQRSQVIGPLGNQRRPLQLRHTARHLDLLRRRLALHPTKMLFFAIFQETLAAFLSKAPRNIAGRVSQVPSRNRSPPRRSLSRHVAPPHHAEMVCPTLTVCNTGITARPRRVVCV